MSRLFLILIPLALLTFFQNCSKAKNSSGELASDASCVGKSDGVCGLSVPGGLRQNIGSLSSLELMLSSDVMAADYLYKISFVNETVTNTANSSSCSIKNNPHWKELKRLYSDNGLCSYTYHVPPEYARCMAMAVPVAYLNDLSSGESFGLSKSICQDDFYNVCGEENVDKFNAEASALSLQISANQACDPL